MMLRTANDAITTNGFGPTRATDSTTLSGKYSEDHNNKESSKTMHPRLSSYFMDLDEFCSASNPKEKNSNAALSTLNQDVPELKSHIPEKDPAGLFPTNAPAAGGQSRLFIPKSVKLNQSPGLSSPAATGMGYTSPMDGTRQCPGAPPALVSASHSSASYSSQQQQQRVVDSAATMVTLYQRHSANTSSSSSQSSSSGAGSLGGGGGGMSSRDSMSENQMEETAMKKRAKRKPREYVYNPKPFKQKAPAATRATAPKDEGYWDKRLKNNVAAKRSRENRRRKEIETVDKCTTLERENAELRERISTLEKQNAWLEGKLTKFLLP